MPSKRSGIHKNYICPPEQFLTDFFQFDKKTIRAFNGNAVQIVAAGKNIEF